MKVLIVENNPSELIRAGAVVRSKKWNCLVCDTGSIDPENPRSRWDWIRMIDEVDVVVTDLMWDHSDHGEKPMGLLVALHALSRNKPVVICTDAGQRDKGHHGEAISFIYDGYISFLRDADCAIGFEEDKDWSRAMDEAAKRHARKQGDSSLS